MIKNEGLFCYHPTEVVVVDDDQVFLQSLKHVLDSSKTNYVFFLNANDAIHYLLDKYEPDPFINRCIKTTYSESLSEFHTKVSIEQIHKEVYNKKRFNEISVVIADYKMPGIDGLEFLAKLSSLPIKTLMLTDAVNENIAIEAFNKELINKFVRKNEENLAGVLNNAIYELQKDYFFQFSHKLLESLIAANGYSNVSMTDYLFTCFFWELCQKHNIYEYYLVDDFGSYLLIDKKGQISWFSLANNTRIAAYYSLAKQHKAPKHIINDISKRLKIPCFGNITKKQRLKVKNLEQYLQPCKNYSAREIYYYAMIPDNRKLYPDLQRNNILCFNDFLEEKTS
ncbi:MAG: response regulator [Gammaproteobacteria bacterium]|nr:response regulator [Gammaproteobacteria bacterium]